MGRLGGSPACTSSGLASLRLRAGTLVKRPGPRPFLSPHAQPCTRTQLEWFAVKLAPIFTVGYADGRSQLVALAVFLTQITAGGFVVAWLLRLETGSVWPVVA
jgi:hypothetical protein